MGADFVGISSDYTTPLPETIAPRLLVVRRKTGYLDLSPGPGDCVHDIFKFTRSPLGGGIYRTSAGRCRTTLQDKFLKCQKWIISQNPFSKFLRNRYGIMYGIICDDSNGMDFLGKIVFSICRTKYAKITDLSCKLSCNDFSWEICFVRIITNDLLHDSITIPQKVTEQISRNNCILIFQKFRLQRCPAESWSCPIDRTNQVCSDASANIMIAISWTSR